MKTILRVLFYLIILGMLLSGPRLYRVVHSMGNLGLILTVLVFVAVITYFVVWVLRLPKE